MSPDANAVHHDLVTVLTINAPWIAALVIVAAVVYVVWVMRRTSRDVMEWSKDLHYESLEAKRDSEKKYESFCKEQQTKYAATTERVASLYESTLAAVQTMKGQ